MKILFSNLPPLFLAISYLFNSTMFAGAVENFFETCRVPNYCGNQTISFPFYIKDVQEQSCGQPGFQISCLNDKSQPILNLSGEDYLIHNIFYENQSIIVSNLAFSRYYSDRNHGRNCNFPKVQNLSLALDQRFEPVSNESKVFIFYGCESSSFSSSTDDQRVKRVGCYEENGTNSTVMALAEDGQLASNVSRECGATVVESAAMTMNHGNNDLGESLRRGLLLKWIAPECTSCNITGGKCGFDFKTRHFQCYCPDQPHAARCNLIIDKKNELKLRLGVGLGLASVALIIITVLLCLKKKKHVLFWKNYQDETQRTVETFLRSCGPLQVRRFNYQEIKKMTKRFEEKLGQGGFGDVYKGNLDNGCLVAVKVLNQSKSDNCQDFINEVATISRTAHVNVVALLGFSFERSKRALIYEFMPNGSLEKFIFGENISHGLDWEKHYQISLGIARGLEYLHRGCNIRIVHFDIKPHNILLDADFVPKISDFGLAKICAKNVSAVSMEVPRGTIGYIAPEIVSRYFGEVSNKSDVYSYGMMILDMVGGRRNVNVRAVNSSEIYFPQWIYKRLELDEELGLKKIFNEGERIKVRKMVIVSLWCIQADPSKRPTMGKVIEMLEGNLDSLQIPPKPFLSSPSRSPGAPSSSTSLDHVNLI